MKPLNIYKKINNIHVNGDDFQLKFDDFDSDKSHNKQIYLNNYDKINNSDQSWLVLRNTYSKNKDVSD